MPGQVNLRGIVLETLLLITKDGEYSHIALKSVLDKHLYLGKQERAFITRVVEGTLERMIELDYIINQFSKVKVNKMKPAIRLILRSGVYQLKYMDSIPDRAVCSESVKLAEKKGFSGLKGFVNGVLRNISRNLDYIAYPGEETGAEHFSVRYSLPEWLVRQWLDTYGSDAVRQMGAAFLEERDTCVRCNLNAAGKEEVIRKLESEGVTVAEDREIPYALHIKGYDYLARLESFQKGYFYVQDISSMEVAEWAKPRNGDVIIDVCAAPGGKAIHMAEKLEGSGRVIACDLTEYKVGLMLENIARSGLSNIEAKQWDATAYDEAMESAADIVLADLPCSGLGVLGKKTDLKYRMTPAMQKELVKLQREILGTICGYVKPGGKLIYSTCTVNKEENEDNALWFVQEHSEFVLLKEQQRFPGKGGRDGFYIALFQKRGTGGNG